MTDVHRKIQNKEELKKKRREPRVPCSRRRCRWHTPSQTAAALGSPRPRQSTRTDRTAPRQSEHPVTLAARQNVRVKSSSVQEKQQAQQYAVVHSPGWRRGFRTPYTFHISMMLKKCLQGGGGVKFCLQIQCIIINGRPLNPPPLKAVEFENFSFVARLCPS